MKKTIQLTDIQRKLIDWFQLEMTDEELKELSRMFTRYYVDKILENNNLKQEKVTQV